MCIVCFKLEQLDLVYKCSVLKLFPYILCFCPNLHISTNKLLIIFNIFIFNVHTIVISYLPTTVIGTSLAQMVKASACNVGDLGLIPGLGGFPGEGNDNPLQYSCLENPMDKRSLVQATVHGVTNYTLLFFS